MITTFRLVARDPERGWARSVSRLYRLGSPFSALRNGAPFVEMPEAFRQLQGQILRKPGGDREMVEILSLVLHHDEQAVLCAVEMALEAGVPTKTHVLNPLHRLVDGLPADQPDVTPPTALTLCKEPEANVARYDGLRATGGTRHAS